MQEKVKNKYIWFSQFLLREAIGSQILLKILTNTFLPNVINHKDNILINMKMKNPITWISKLQ